MKHLVSLAVTLLLAGGWPAPASAQSVPIQLTARAAFPEDARIGYVDIERVAALSNEGKAATAKLGDLRKRKDAELAESSKQLESLQQKLAQSASVMAEPALGRLRRDFERARINFQRLSEDAQAEVQDTQQQLLRQFTERLFPVIGQVATEKKLWAVFGDENNPLWYLPAIDLSEEVAKRLDAIPAAGHQ